MSRCGCGSPGDVAIANGPNTVVTGSGTPSNPFVIASHTDCAEARACFSASLGVALDAGTGNISAVVSPAVGNSLSVSPAGLFVSPSISTVTSGSGLLGVGTVGNPVRLNGSAWNFPSTADLGGSLVYTDSTGKVRGEPGYHSYYQQSQITNTYTTPLAVPAGALANADVPFNYTVTNTDAYRSVRVVSVREFDARLTIPAGGAASAGADGIETYRMQNTGSTTMTGVHAYASWMVTLGTIAPAGTLIVSMQPQLGGGAGSATCTQISMSHRIMLLPV